MFSTLIILVLILLLLAFWFDSMKSKEAAVATAKMHFERETVLLLDDTVALKKLRLTRNTEGRVCLKRFYTFEYSLSNQQRYSGRVIVAGRETLECTLTITPTHLDQATSHQAPIENTADDDNVIVFKRRQK